MSISDISGKPLRTWKLVPKAGLNEWLWNFRTEASGRRRGGGTQPVLPGDYLVSITQAGQKQQKIGRFTKVLGWRIGAVSQEKE